MFGPSLLIAPKVWDYMAEYPISLPVGEWFELLDGRQSDRWPPPRSKSQPGYITRLRAHGSIIPRQPVVQNVDEVPRGPLVLGVYPGPECQGSLYADNGNTLAYHTGIDEPGFCV
jgi:alpha-glucosidase